VGDEFEKCLEYIEGRQQSDIGRLVWEPDIDNKKKKRRVQKERKRRGKGPEVIEAPKWV